MDLDDMFALKQEVFCHFEKVIEDKVHSLQKTLYDLIESTRNETKSSAGDKYETARAMLQIEQDNTRQQLQQALEQKSACEKIELATGTEIVKKGSLVKTASGYFFVSVGLGKIKIGDSVIIAVSPSSPLGSKLIGSVVSDSITVNGANYLIQGIC